MKKILLIITLFIATILNAQQNVPYNSNPSDQYFKKYQRQKKAANILSVTGGVFVVTGVVVSAQSDRSDNGFISAQDLAGVTLVGVGVVAALTSVPFYISAYSNKRKSVKIQPDISINNVRTGENLTSQTSLGIYFSF